MHTVIVEPPSVTFLAVGTYIAQRCPECDVLAITKNGAVATIALGEGVCGEVEWESVDHGVVADPPHFLRSFNLRGNKQDVLTFVKAAVEAHKRRRFGEHHAFVHDGEFWTKGPAWVPRPPESVFGPLEKLIADIDTHLATRDELAALGIPPTRKYLIRGVPGSGKTTAAKMLATQLGLGLAVLHPSGGLRSQMTCIPEPCVFVLEDAERVSPDILRDTIDAMPEGVFVATTTSTGPMDPALRRRFDVQVDLPEVCSEEVARRMARRFGIDSLDFDAFWLHARPRSTCAGMEAALVHLRKRPGDIQEAAAWLHDPAGDRKDYFT